MASPPPPLAVHSPLKRRAVWGGDDQIITPSMTMAHVRCMTPDTPPHYLESTPDSESTKGHPKQVNNNSHVLSSSHMRQKYRIFFRPNYILMSILLLLSAGVPFIVHLHYLESNNQREHKMDSPPLFERGQLKRVMMELDNTQQQNEEDLFVPSKKGHFLRRNPTSNKLKFYPFTKRDNGIPLPQWNLLMPDSKDTIKLDDGITVSLKNSIVRNKVSGRVQDNSEDATELNTKDENGLSGDENTSSQVDNMLSSSTETAAWDPDQECIPMADWQTRFHPSCNSVHEMDMPTLLNQKAYSLVSDKGFWRNAWNVDMNVAENGMSPVSNIVIKSLKYIHNPNYETFELNRVDGVSMEQLSHSQHITDIYGYCGTTSLQEFAGAGSLDTYLRELQPIEKLRVAAWIAAGMADIHEMGEKKGNNDVGYSPSVSNNSTTVTASLIHNDINLGNILMGYRDGKRVPLINDFNIAIFRKKDASTGASCRFRGLFFNPQWMAPEQMSTIDREDGLSIGFLNEKIDVYALGNILHFVAVGQPPWKFQGRKRAKKIGEEYYQKKKAEWDVHITRSKLKGVKPKIPDEVKNSDDPSIQALLNAMYWCYRSDPDARLSAREIAEYLNGNFLALDRNKQ